MVLFNRNPCKHKTCIFTVNASRRGRVISCSNIVVDFYSAQCVGYNTISAYGQSAPDHRMTTILRVPDALPSQRLS